MIINGVYRQRLISAARKRDQIQENINSASTTFALSFVQHSVNPRVEPTDHFQRQNLVNWFKEQYTEDQHFSVKSSLVTRLSILTETFANESFRFKAWKTPHEIKKRWEVSEHATGVLWHHWEDKDLSELGFPQDGDNCHIARKISLYLQRSEIDWPPSSYWSTPSNLFLWRYFE